MLKSLLQKKQIDALKARDSEKLDFIRYILAQIKNAEIEKRHDLTDEEVKIVMNKVNKQIEDGIDAAKKGSRVDLQVKYEKQKKVLSSITK
ncbi:MAG: GatB/YqeY domain-containing protein [bacterium]